jgi:hypothetical protein
MPVATQKTDTGLTPGLLRVLNRQVIKWYFLYDLLKDTMACIAFYPYPYVANIGFTFLNMNLVE